MKIESNPSASSAAQLTEKTASRGLSRRALLRTGAGASPVLLTLASGPVAANPFGGGAACVLASSFVSVATFKSRNPAATSMSCAAQKVEYWRDQAALPPPNPMPVPPTGLDVTVATLLGSTGSTYDSQTVRSVLLSGGAVATTGELGTLQHLLAMALNINSGNMTVGGGFDLAYLQSIWSNYKSNGNRYKVPASGIDWGDVEIISWARLLLGYVLLP